MTNETPDISIITATYNRSNILKFTIESVRAQKCRHTWEQWVIGDACTDDTEAVVAGFKDPRIRFHNLPENVGEQSGPNNEGFDQARGKYIAYVSHDDLWFPDHLARAMEVAESDGVDGVFAMGLALDPGGSVHLMGASRTGMYHPNMGVPASLWVMRREMITALGGWRLCCESYVVPSQDFLLRAWKAGFRIRMVPAATVICIQAGLRKNSYSQRQEAEHAEAARRMKTDAGYREALLLTALQTAEGADMFMPVWPGIRRLAGNLLKRLCMVFGIAPVQAISVVLGRRKGGIVKQLRRTEGLPPAREMRRGR